MKAITGGAPSRAIRECMARSKLLRGIIKSEVSQTVIRLVRRRAAVRERWRFVLAVVLAPSRVVAFRLRGSSIRVLIRPGTRDGDIFDEIFVGERAYEPPPQAASLLESVHGPLRVLDLGGNVGLFGAFVFNHFGDVDVTSVEPDPANAEILARCIASNGLQAKWRLIRACAGTRPGSVTLEAGRFADSRIVETSEGNVIEVPQVDVFDLVHDVDLLKMDIEGSEWAILADDRFRHLDARVTILEWHDYRGPRAPREVAIRSLVEAGYVVMPSVPSDVFPHGTVWAWRPQIPTRER